MDRTRRLVERVKTFIASLDDENDYFRPMKYLLVIGGIYLPTQDPFYRRLFLCYQTMLGIQFVVWADRVYVAMFEWNSRGDLIGVMTFFLAVVMIVLRAGLIRLYMKKIEAVCAFLNRQLDEHRTGRRDQSYRLVRLIAVVLEVTFFVDQIMFYVFGVHRDRLYSTPDNISRMDWRVKLFFDVANASNHFVYSSLYVTILTVLNSLLMAFKTEMEDVVLEFEGIFERVDLKLNEVIVKDERIKEQPNLREALEELFFWKILEKELNSAIIRHSTLLEQLDNLSGFFKMTFLLMFYMEIVVLGCASFYIIGQGLTMNSIIVGTYSATHLVDCYWFCRLVDNLNVTNNLIGSAVFNLDWPQRLRKKPCSAKLYRQIRTTLLMVMNKSQQNLGISCGGMFEMSVEAYQQLVNMIYSFLMFLLNTNAAAHGK